MFNKEGDRMTMKYIFMGVVTAIVGMGTLFGLEPQTINVVVINETSKAYKIAPSTYVGTNPTPLAPHTVKAGESTQLNLSQLNLLNQQVNLRVLELSDVEKGAHLWPAKLLIAIEFFGSSPGANTGKLIATPTSLAANKSLTPEILENVDLTKKTDFLVQLNLRGDNLEDSTIVFEPDIR
jgi:hypothetical protein